MKFQKDTSGPWAWPGRVVVLTYLAIGLGLVFQPDRFSQTPSYANLLEILDAEIWGVLYMLSALLIAVYLLAVANRFYGIAAHTFAVMLTAIWLAAFVIRWFTDTSTTVVNIASWAVFLFLIIRSSTLIDVSEIARGATTITATSTVDHDNKDNDAT